jgi:hypothetical protein
MTRAQCLKLLKTDKEFKALYYRNYSIARKLHKKTIDSMKALRPDMSITLHHEPGDKNYELWNPVTPMYKDEHTSLHFKGTAHRKGSKHTDEAKAKISAAGKGRKHTDEARAKMSAYRRGKGKYGVTDDDHNEYCRTRRAKEPKAHLDYDRAYREANRQRIKSRQAEWYQVNKERHKEQRDRWLAANKEKKKADDKAYRESKRDEINQKQRERLAKMSPEEREKRKEYNKKWHENRKVKEQEIFYDAVKFSKGFENPRR